MSIVLIGGEKGKSARDGLSVVELKQDKKATEEMNQFFREVYGG